MTHVIGSEIFAPPSPQVRKDGTVPWLRPDGKTQVTVEYRKEGGAMIPLRVHTVLISTQHNEDVTNDQIHKDLMEHVIKPVVPTPYTSSNIECTHHRAARRSMAPLQSPAFSTSRSAPR